MTSFWHSNLVPELPPQNKPTTSGSEITINKSRDKNIWWIKTSQNILLNLIFQNLPTLKGPFLSVFFWVFRGCFKDPVWKFRDSRGGPKNLRCQKCHAQLSTELCPTSSGSTAPWGKKRVGPHVDVPVGGCSFSSKLSFLVYFCFVWLVVSLFVGLVDQCFFAVLFSKLMSFCPCFVCMFACSCLKCVLQGHRVFLCPR